VPRRKQDLNAAGQGRSVGARWAEKQGFSVHESADSHFEILAPACWTLPVVFNSPHSGNLLPAEFLGQSRLAPEQLHASEDSHVDALFVGCVQLGAPLLRAHLSRSYLDLNREPYEFDPKMFDERLPTYMNCTSPRVASGLGTIPRTVGDGVNIYRGSIPLAEALARVERYYRPYHRTLASLLDEAHRAMGEVLLVDCHSMPSSAVPEQRLGRCDVVLGDRFGSACDNQIVDLVEHHFQHHGLQTLRNRPYAGGFFTESHGRPKEGRHALQVELNRALYMDEGTRQPNSSFSDLRACLDALAEKLARHFAVQSTPALAAE
jgi:N-formylglutamate amidohydrolase